MEQAAAAGFDRGAHHFFTLCRPGADQARNFLATAPPDPDALAPVVDLDRARWQRRLLRRPTGAGWRTWQVHDFAAVGGVDLNVMRKA